VKGLYNPEQRAKFHNVMLPYHCGLMPQPFAWFGARWCQHHLQPGRQDVSRLPNAASHDFG
jgi:hypothetical protein